MEERNQEMSVADNLRLYSEFREAINNHDPKSVADFFAPDSVLAVYGGMSLQGREQIERYFKNTFVARPDYRVDNVDIMADDERVYSDSEYSGTFSGPDTRSDGTTIPPTGNFYIYNAISRAKIQNGKIAELRIGMNQLDYYSQLGLLS